ncbi:MAG: STAS domain-containing protein [Oxalobacteraceae bacterium]
MKIFSLFNKKQQTQASTPAESAHARDASGKNIRANSQAELSINAQSAQSDRRSAARATELKIDAIESAMSLQLDGPPRANRTSSTTADRGRVNTKVSASFRNTVQLIDASTEILFNDGRPDDAIALADTLPSPIIEEAAILFANDQQTQAERLLENAILQATPADQDEHAYLLLFDLYQLGGRQQAFDSLSNDYIIRFETSPPAWRDSIQQAPQLQPALPETPASNPPIVVFPKVLDADSAQQIAHAQQQVSLLGAAHQVLQLDLSHIRQTDPGGCAAMLQFLYSLHQTGHVLVLLGAPTLIEHFQSTLQTGQRDSGGGAESWLLLLELLRLSNREQEFEESSIEYCITFEISPPAFEAPRRPSTTAGEGRTSGLTSAAQTAATSLTERFAMPNLVIGDTKQLTEAIIAFAAERETVIIDCTQLNRIDFSASGQLLTGLVPLASDGKIIEFHQVNHPVAALLNVMGLKEIARIIPHKG